ncbi:OLC1v1038224C1 [Oldenlandia corymbosa var. corymbosa]|uniref:OLC1v1038224C1 n=1 Tax=Oldenlandia corymbosa var. corymbosa TaxID=529605 RepID=A0AAV1CZF4_OLDCO|nr:OLC1v1038224C1 [Oldenlandia corymbosa var. corymbosa]
MHVYQFLRVLDVENLELDVIPSEVGLLVRIAYLAVGGRFANIPPSFPSPDNFWNMRQLKQLYVRGDLISGGGVLPVENVDSSSALHGLERISGVVISYAGSKRVMEKFPNIRKLKCRFEGFKNEERDVVEIVVPDILSHLESLHMAIDEYRLHKDFDIVVL